MSYITKDLIKDILGKIESGGVVGNGYASNKTAISQLFSATSDEKEEDILLRLTVIDSMYSTQMNKRYYALEDLAKAMFAIGTEKNCPLAKLFTEFTMTLDASLFDYRDGNLFGNRYGIGKDGGSKGVAISLISKYAYFTTNYQFPIFDTIVCETLPCLVISLGPQKKKPSLRKKDNKQRILGMETMVRFVSVINKFISGIDSSISYDSLDRLVWFVGKIRRGNLSLILSKDEYVRWIKTHKC